MSALLESIIFIGRKVKNGESNVAFGDNSFAFFAFEF